MKLSITNRSSWPDWFVNPVTKWVCKQAGIDFNYSVVLVNSKVRFFAGRANKYRCRIRINRRMNPPNGWPFETSYYRYKWSHKYLLNNRLECFVFIMAHEMYHATGGHPSKWRTAGGRCDESKMETACDMFADKCVRDFRVIWPKMRETVKKLARKSHIKTKARSVRNSLKRSDPSPKLVAAQNKLKFWQKKSKLAATKLKIYKKKIKYYEGRLAARSTSS